MPEPGEQENADRPDDVRLVRWLVKEGKSVCQGSRVAVIETSSGQYEVLANGNGSIKMLLVQEGAIVSLSSALATINANGEDVP